MDSQEQQSNLIQLAAEHLDRHTEKKVSQQYFDVILKSI
jgi:hypothetical protein